MGDRYPSLLVLSSGVIVVDFTYSDLAADLGTSTADGLRNLANTAANVYCDAYAAYAGAFAPATSPIGLVRAIDAFNSRLCSPRNKRPANAPLPPFTGGQCPIRYNVLYRTTQPSGQSTGTAFNVLGPIRGVAIDPEPGNRRRFSVWGAPDPPSRPDGKVGILVSGSGFDPSLFSLEIISVSPVGGGSDSCGNPQPGYPPVIAPSASLNVPVSVNLGGFTLNANAVIIAPKFSASVNAEVGVTVKIGDFNVQFDAGGVTINNEFKPDVDISLPDGGGTDGRSNPPPPKEVKRSDDCADVLAPDLGEIKKLLDELKDCACDPNEFESVSFGEADSLIYQGSREILSARLVLTTVPSTVRSQSGNAGAPDVYFAGWFAWGAGAQAFGERIPVSYVQNEYLAPRRAKSCSFTLTNGAKGVLSIIRRKPQD